MSPLHQIPAGARLAARAPRAGKGPRPDLGVRRLGHSGLAPPGHGDPLTLKQAKTITIRGRWTPRQAGSKSHSAARVREK
jgi:hypothetical protein